MISLLQALIILAYSQYTENSECLELVAGKSKLPCNFYKLVSINYKGHPVYWATNTNAHNYQCDNCQIPVCSHGQCEYTFYFIIIIFFLLASI